MLSVAQIGVSQIGLRFEAKHRSICVSSSDLGFHGHSNGDIVAELANRNRDRYSKDGTGKYGGVRIKGDVDKGQWLDPRALNTKMEKHMGISTHQVEPNTDDSDTSSRGTCELPCTSQNLDGCDSLYCSADYRAPDDEF